MNATEQTGQIKKLMPIIAVVLFVSVAVVGYTTCTRLVEMLHQALVDHARVETVILASVLGDPFSMGEYDHLQQIVETAKRNDAQLLYAVVMSSDGRVLATTDSQLANQTLTRNPFEKDALAVTDVAVREIPNSTDKFEVAMAIKTAAGQAGVIRAGFSKSLLSQAISSTLVSVIITAVAAALLGLWAVDQAFRRQRAASN
jgi:hypothetical protein